MVWTARDGAGKEKGRLSVLTCCSSAVRSHYVLVKQDSVVDHSLQTGSDKMVSLCAFTRYTVRNTPRLFFLIISCTTQAKKLILD